MARTSRGASYVYIPWFWVGLPTVLNNTIQGKIHCAFFQVASTACLLEHLLSDPSHIATRNPNHMKACVRSTLKSRGHSWAPRWRTHQLWGISKSSILRIQPSRVFSWHKLRLPPDFKGKGDSEQELLIWAQRTVRGGKLF